MVESNVIHRLEPSLAYNFIDTGPSTVDSAILSGHDNLQCVFIFDVTGECGDFRDNDHDLG